MIIYKLRECMDDQSLKVHLFEKNIASLFSCFNKIILQFNNAIEIFHSQFRLSQSKIYGRSAIQNVPSTYANILTSYFQNETLKTPCKIGRLMFNAKKQASGLGIQDSIDEEKNARCQRNRHTNGIMSHKPPIKGSIVFIVAFYGGMIMR